MSSNSLSSARRRRAAPSFSSSTANTRTDSQFSSTLPSQAVDPLALLSAHDKMIKMLPYKFSGLEDKIDTFIDSFSEVPDSTEEDNKVKQLLLQQQSLVDQNTKLQGRVLSLENLNQEFGKAQQTYTQQLAQLSTALKDLQEKVDSHQQLSLEVSEKSAGDDSDVIDESASPTFEIKN